jgi:putative phosphonate metabolism protein
MLRICDSLAWIEGAVRGQFRRPPNRFVAARYAVYFAPPQQSLLWSIGCAWLGRDPASGQAIPQPGSEDIPLPQLRELTASPCMYGLHATLKAPFRLIAAASQEDLVDAVRTLASRHAVFELPKLEIGLLAQFIAVRTVGPSAPLQRLADATVVELDRFRLPPDDEELSRRRAASLTQRQNDLLRRYGYPYVLDQWRFHITLTERLNADDAERLQPWLREHFRDALASPLHCTDVCLFSQALPNANFRLLRRFPLTRN